MTASFRDRLMGLLLAASGIFFAGLPAANGSIVDSHEHTTGTPTGTSTAQQPALLGVVLEDSTQPFEIRNDAGALLASGTLRQEVVRENVRNTLDFYYQVTQSSGSHPIFSLEVSGFQPGKLNIDYLTGSGDLHPSRVVNLAGGTIAAFNFDATNFITPGHSTTSMFVRTLSKQFLTDPTGSAATLFAAHLPGDNDFVNLISNAVPTVRPVPVPIPLPPAFFAGLIVMLPLGIALIRRRQAMDRTK